MNRSLRHAVLSLASASLLALFSGCKVSSCPDTTSADSGVSSQGSCLQIQPLKKYVDGTPRTSTVASTAGKNVSVLNGNGQLTVAATTADQVSYTAVGFQFEGPSDADRQKATDFLKGFASPSITDDGAGNLRVEAAGGGNHGYDIVVNIPTGFSGALRVENGNGATTVHGSRDAAETRVVNDNGDIVADNLAHVIVLQTENGDVDARGTPSGTGSEIRSDLGDVKAVIGVDANLVVTAKTDNGVVTFPASWTAQTVAMDRKSGTATLGDGTGTLAVMASLGDIDFAAP